MPPKKFFKLSIDQQDALVIAMHVRNEMEDFHCEYLSDSQMKELNKIIRTAIFEALVINRRVVYKARDSYWNEIFSWLVMSVPDYWEIPTEKDFIKKFKELRKEWGFCFPE